MRPFLRQAAVLLALAAGIAAATALLHPRAPAWFLTAPDDRWEITPDRLGELGPIGLWVDARSEPDYDAGHLPGAILLNEDDWGNLVFIHQDRLQSALGKPVVVYCDGRGCERSRHVAQRLRELIGLDPVYVLHGDWRRVATK